MRRAASPNASSLKATLRREAGTLRARLHGDSGGAAARAIAASALPFLDNTSPRIVSGYHAIGSEIDPSPLMHRLAEAGHKIALPIVVERGRPLVFRAWAPGDQLKRTWRGIGEPLDSAEPVVPDVLLVPLLLVDRDGYRLGYGAGYYDLTLAALRRSRRIVAVGIGFEGQIVDMLPRDAHDQPVDWILTENGAVRVRERGVGNPA